MIKRILVHLDASPRAAERLALAQELARRHGAEVTVLYGVLPALMATAWAAGEGIAAAATLLADLDEQQRRRARAVFDEAQAAGKLRWEDGAEAPYWALHRHALTSDLLVLGQHDADDRLTGALPPGLVPASIVDGGRPTLVVPAVGSYTAAGGPVLLAWKGTREAARAVSAALPWLRQATRVHVAQRPETAGPQAAPDAELAAWLQAQGVQAPTRWHALGDVEVGEGLLSLAAEVGAELLAMGCYGHSRAREWVLGGATRTVLRSMTLPVLMVH
jgi:nucleotide-binding universal stress UspA family protein